jgi:hypothetical protein
MQKISGHYNCYILFLEVQKIYPLGKKSLTTALNRHKFYLMGKEMRAGSGDHLQDAEAGKGVQGVRQSG